MSSARTRFLLEVGFIVVVAVGAGLAELDVPMIVLLIGLAWLLVAFVEWSAWQEAARTRPSEADVAIPTATEVLHAAAVGAEDERTSGREAAPDLAEDLERPVAAAARAAEEPPAPIDEPPAPIAEPPAPIAQEQGQPAPVASDGPRQWNIWYLERIVRERAGGDALRDEERAALLMYLREFANADGLLPVDFDGLVRESFDELIGSTAPG